MTTSVATAKLERHPRYLENVASTVRKGGLVVVADDSRAILMLAARTASVHGLATMIRLTSGFVQVALPAQVCDRLMIPEASAFWNDAHSNAAAGQCVAVDAADGAGTGISASDRAHTIRVLSSVAAEPNDLSRPGHVVPIRVPTSSSHSQHGAMPSRLVTAAFALTSNFAAPGSAFADLSSHVSVHEMASAVEAQAIAATLDFPFVTVNEVLAEAETTP